MLKGTPLIFVLLLASCGYLTRVKFEYKKIVTEELIVEWYYYANFTSNGPDLVVVKKNNVEQEIFKGVGVVTNVSVQNKTIVIRLTMPYQGIVYTKEPLRNVFGYNILFDTTASYDEYILRPEPQKK